MYPDILYSFYKIDKKSQRDSNYCQVTPRGQFKIVLCSSVYNQLYEILLGEIKTRENKSEAHKICKLFFFIHFCCSLENSKITREDLYWAITYDKRYFKRNMEILEKLNLVSVHKEFTTYIDKQGNTKYKQLVNQYSVPNLHLDIDFNQENFIILEYIVPNKDLIKRIKTTLKKIKNFIKSNNNIPTIPIGGIDSQLTDCASTALVIKNTRFSLRDFCTQYSRLEYRNLLGDIDIDETNKLAEPAVMKEDGRIYHRFDYLPAEIRTSRIYLDGERLVEGFDVNNSHHCLLNCFLPEYIPQEEKNRFWNITMSGNFYENLRDWINTTYGANWTREDAKEYANVYYNKINIDYVTKFVDDYFKENFPNIRNFILSFSEVKIDTGKTFKRHLKSGKTIEVKKTRKVRQIYKKFNEVETKVMIYGICAELFEKYGIRCLTVHDGIYLKESDNNYLKTNNISLKSLFLNYINLYKFI